MIFFRRALKNLSNTLADVFSELWTERAAAIKLLEPTEQAQNELDQQQWRGTPLPSNQPIMESFWQSSMPTSLTTTTTVNSQASQNKNKQYNRLRPGRPKASATYKTPKVQCNIEGYIQRTPTMEEASGAAPRGISVKEGGAAAKWEKEKR